jgi:hypothetical protein
LLTSFDPFTIEKVHTNLPIGRVDMPALEGFFIVRIHLEKYPVNYKNLFALDARSYFQFSNDEGVRINLEVNLCTMSVLETGNLLIESPLPSNIGQRGKGYLYCLFRSGKFFEMTFSVLRD